MAVIQDININVYAQPSEKRLRTFLTLSQNENGRLINFRILGAPLPSNCVATFSGTKPDGNVYSTTGTVTGNFVVVAEDMQMTAVAGVWDAKLDIVNGTHNIMTALIRVVVDADVVDPNAIASDSQLQGLVAEAKYYAEEARIESFGAPLTATLTADMLDHTRVYVYTGSETGMSNGHWYYWDGSAWTDGGVYNAAALDTDKTLSVPDKAADGKATGDALALKVDKVTGKGLSTNDYTTAEKNKLSGIAVGATKVEIDTTLSTAGKAADAKETGDKISELKEDLSKISGTTRNLFSVDDITLEAGLSESDGVFTNTNTDTRSFFSLMAMFLDADGVNKGSAFVNISSAGRYEITVTPSADCKKIDIKHNGSTRDLRFTFDIDTIANLPYTFSCDVTGYDPTSIGGISFKNVQFEQNAHATEYIVHETATDKQARENVDYLMDKDAELDSVPSITWTTGQYVNNSGVMTSLSGFKTSDAINLYYGQKITVRGKGYSTIVAMISKVEIVNGIPVYTPLVMSIDANVHDYSYTATECMNVIVSVQTSGYESTAVELKVQKAIEEISDDVNTLINGESNPFADSNILRGGGMIGIFHKIGCIGNSLASGETVANDTGVDVYHDMFNYSWGQCIARMCGVTAYNFSRGGQSAATWMSEWANHATFTGNPCTLYLIGLGVNDSNPDSIAYTAVGTSADIDLSDYTNNADSFYGQYGAIIQRIKQVSEKAKIFVMTMPNITDNAKLAYNTAIKDMANIFTDVFVMDLAEYGNSYFAKIKANTNIWKSGHGTAVSYKMIADFICTYVDWFVRNNTDKFKNVQFIDSEWNLT